MRIEEQDEVKRSLLRRMDEVYYSDEEDLGLSRRMEEKLGESEMDFDGKINTFRPVFEKENYKVTAHE